jgi:hypothetical protein
MTLRLRAVLVDPDPAKAGEGQPARIRVRAVLAARQNNASNSASRGAKFERASRHLGYPALARFTRWIAYRPRERLANDFDEGCR